MESAQIQITLSEADMALHQKDGWKALKLAQSVLEQEDTCSRAWYIAMQCFQLIYPPEQAEAEKERECARYAIRFAPKEEKARVQKKVYAFLLDKTRNVLSQDAQVLADAKELLSFYQREAYFDRIGAVKKARQRDALLLTAVQHTFQYAQDLYAFIPPSAIKRSAFLQAKAKAVADQWQKTYSYLAMRLGLYQVTLTEEEISKALETYAFYLRPIKDREEILKVPVPFNTQGLDQLAFLEG